MSHPANRQARLVRTRQRQPDFVRKAGPHGRAVPTTSRRAELIMALEEWADEINSNSSKEGAVDYGY